jgi:chemotaxis methyl-accepting protein methylase
VALRFAGLGDDSEPSAEALMRWVSENFLEAGPLDTWDEVGEKDGVLRVPLQVGEKRLEVLLLAEGATAPAGRPAAHRGDIPGAGRRFEVREAPPALDERLAGLFARWRGGAPSVYGQRSWLPFLKLLDLRKIDHAAVADRAAIRALVEALRLKPRSVKPDDVWRALEGGPLVLPWRGMFADWPEKVWNDLQLVFEHDLAIMPASGVEKMTVMAKKAGVDWNLKGVRFIRGPPEALPGLDAERFVTWTSDGYAVVHAETLKKWKSAKNDASRSLFKALFLALLHENHEYTSYLHHAADGLTPSGEDLEKWDREAVELGFHPDNPNALSEILVALPGSAHQTAVTEEKLEKWQRRVEGFWKGKNPQVVDAYRDIVANNNADDDLLPLLAEFADTPGFDRMILRAQAELKHEYNVGILGELYHASRLRNMGYQIEAFNVVVSNDLDTRNPPFLEIDLIVRKQGLFYLVEAHHTPFESPADAAPAVLTALRKAARGKLNLEKLKKYRRGVREIRRIYAESREEPTTRRRVRAPELLGSFVSQHFAGNRAVAEAFFEQLTHSTVVPVVLTLTDPSGAAFTPEGEAFEREYAETIMQRSASWEEASFPAVVHVFPQHVLNRFAQTAKKVQVNPLRRTFLASRRAPVKAGPEDSTRRRSADVRRAELAAARAVFNSLVSGSGNRDLYDAMEAAVRARFSTKRKVNKNNQLVDEVLAVAFLPFLRLRVSATGAESLDAYGESLKKNWHEKDFLVRTLRRSLEPTKSQTEFFFQRENWGLDEFLPGLIDAKVRAGDLRLRLKSLGSASGEEPYSLAIAAREALEGYFEARRGSFPGVSAEEWIDRWDVQIDAYDVNLPNLYMTHMGFFDDLDSLPERYSGRFAMGYEKFEAAKDLRRWVVPQYLDLNDPEQLTILRRGDADAVFLVRTLFQPEADMRPAVLDAVLGSLSPSSLLVFTAGDADGALPVLSLERREGAWARTPSYEAALSQWKSQARSRSPRERDRAALVLGVLGDPAAAPAAKGWAEDHPNTAMR